MNALKLTLIPPVGLHRVSAPRTFLRRVSRIYVLNMAGMSFSLIIQELFQLIERPTMELASLLLPLFTPFPNVLKILNHKRGPNRSTLNNTLRDTVIHVPTKTVLLLRKLLKVSFRRPGTTRLKLCPQSMISLSNITYMSTTEELFFRGHSNATDTSVYTDKGLRGIIQIWYIFFKDKCKKYYAFTVDQVSRFTSPISELVKIVIGLKFDAFLASLFGKDRNFVFIEPNGMGLGIEAYGAQF